MFLFVLYFDYVLDLHKIVMGENSEATKKAPRMLPPPPPRL